MLAAMVSIYNDESMHVAMVLVYDGENMLAAIVSIYNDESMHVAMVSSLW